MQLFIEVTITNLGDSDKPLLNSKLISWVNLNSLEPENYRTGPGSPVLFKSLNH